MELVLNNHGIRVTKRNKCFFLETEKHQRIVSPNRISSILVTTECHFSSSAIFLAVENQIPIVFLNKAGKCKARLWSSNFGSIATLRRKQAFFAETTDATKWIIETLKMKYEGQNRNIMFLDSALSLNDELSNNWSGTKEYLDKLTSFDDIVLKDCADKMMGLEGAISKVYWASIASTIGKDFGFETRSRMPSKDILNALLNYWYGMLYGITESALISVGLDPYMGFLHADEYNRPALTYDFIEPFRPWVDRLIIKKALEFDINNDMFEKKGDGFWLASKAKRKYITIFNDYFEEKNLFLENMKKRKNHILSYAQRLASIINNTDLK